jgi:hypothetical protein
MASDGGLAARLARRRGRARAAAQEERPNAPADGVRFLAAALTS